MSFGKGKDAPVRIEKLIPDRLYIKGKLNMQIYTEHVSKLRI